MSADVLGAVRQHYGPLVFAAGRWLAGRLPELTESKMGYADPIKGFSVANKEAGVNLLGHAHRVVAQCAFLVPGH